MDTRDAQSSLASQILVRKSKLVERFELFSQGEWQSLLIPVLNATNRRQ